ncbi:MAG: hypothetical protein LUF85_09925 [Bacteroides sp.]|nr:hypothetical protein [Bacteroides sp.]
MKEKKYKELPEQEPMMVGEPAVAYTPTSQKYLTVSDEENTKKSLLERKAEFIRAVLNDMDEETFDALEMDYLFLHTKGEGFPCRYSVEELKERVREATCQIKNGEFIAHEDLDKYILE